MELIRPTARARGTAGAPGPRPASASAWASRLGVPAQVEPLHVVARRQLGGRARPARSGRPPARRRGRRPAAPSWRSARPAPPRCPARGSRVMIRAIRPTICGASPSEGSSSSSSFGSDISARPMASICCSPPDSSPARCAGPLGEHREQLAHPVPGGRLRGGRRTGPEPTGAQVLLDGHPGEHLAALRHGDDAAAHDECGVEPVDPLAVEGDLAGGDRPAVQLQRAGDRAQQRRLARAVAARAPRARRRRAPRCRRPRARSPSGRTAPTARGRSAPRPVPSHTQGLLLSVSPADPLRPARTWCSSSQSPGNPRWRGARDS